MPLYEFLRQEVHAPERYVLPVPFFNMLNGGVHSGNQMALQEFMIAPVGAESMAQAVQIGCEVYQELKDTIKRKYGIGGRSLDRSYSLSGTVLIVSPISREYWR